MMAGIGSLRAAKKDLRQSMKQILSTVSADSIELQSRNVVDLLSSLPEYRAARRISVYLSMPTAEISTYSIVRDALRQGKQVFVPYIYRVSTSNGRFKPMMEMLALRSQEDYDSLLPDAWGIPSLDLLSIPERENCLGDIGRQQQDRVGREEGEGGLDLILMPGVAFDRNLGRLGHGKGFYDLFLSRYRDSKAHKHSGSESMPFRVGLALREQLLPSGQSVPVDENDWHLDGLVVGDNQYISAGES